MNELEPVKSEMDLQKQGMSPHGGNIAFKNDSKFVRIPLKADEIRFTVSVREQLAMEVMLSTGGNMSEAARQVTEKYKRNVSRATIKRWIATRPHIKEYLNKRLNELTEFHDLTKEGYFLKMKQLAEGDAKVRNTTYQFWKLVGEIKGFLGQETMGSGGVTANITFVQADGSK